MKKKILILGCGNAQVDLIEYCKKNNFITYGCSNNDLDKGISLLDSFKLINITDIESVSEYIKQEGIQYIYSIGSDIAMPTVMKVAEICGLNHFISSETAVICNNKQLMRTALGSEFVSNVPFICCSSLFEALKYRNYPAILKPVDSQGQRGVFKVENEDDLKKYFYRAYSKSRSGQVIIEKYIPGDEVSVNAYVHNGKVIFSIVSDREAFHEFPGGIIKAHHLPSRYEGSTVIDKLFKLVEDTVKILGIVNGPVYCQIKISAEEPYIIEITPRLDGCHMWHLIKEYCGVDLLDVTVKHLTADKIEQINSNPSKHRYTLEFICEKPNTVFIKRLYSNPECIKLYYESGDCVREINGYMEKCGYQIRRSPGKIGLVGGSGFIGQQFIQDYSKSYDIKNISRKNGMVEDYSIESLTEAVSDCDSVVILAGKKVDAEEKQSFAIYQDNITILENTLLACIANNVKNIVFTSSRCVYGGEHKTSLSEDTLLDPINFYGISKAACERICRHYNKKYGLNIKILRLSQVVGQIEGNEYILPVYILGAMEKKQLLIYGNAKGQRDYIYVKDVCKGILWVLKHAEKSGIYNLGSGIGVNNYELARAVCKAFDNEGNYQFLKDKPEDESITILNVQKIKDEFGFTCDYNLDTMLCDISNGKGGNK